MPNNELRLPARKNCAVLLKFRMPLRFPFLVNLWAYALCALVVFACGSRTGPHQDTDDQRYRRNVTPIPDQDAGADAGEPISPVEVDCQSEHIDSRPGLAVALGASATAPSGIVSQSLRLIEAPPGSTAELIVFPGNATGEFMPDIGGDFIIEYVATDALGNSNSCEIAVHSVLTPPVAVCIETDVATFVNVPILLAGAALDRGSVVSSLWEVVESPPGSAPRLSDAEPVPLAGTSVDVIFGTDIGGLYIIRLTVTSQDRLSESCEINITVTGAPLLECPETAFEGPTRQGITISVPATDDVGIASRQWQVLSSPSGSVALPSPANADTMTFTPDRIGDYLLEYVVGDVEGLSASCLVTVIGHPSPPTVSCPARVTVSPLDTATVSATAVDDGTVESFSWTLVDLPTGSVPTGPSPTTGPVTMLTPDIAGEFKLLVTATDDMGMTGECSTVVAATNNDGIRVEMFWDVGSSDMDLHLLNPQATAWAEDNNHCFYGNCRATAPNWGAAGPDDDPHLDIDNTDGFGPENINVFRPAAGTYRVAVHNFRHDLSVPSVTVRIFCRDSDTAPRQTFGPVTLPRNGMDFWRVADVTIDASGNCNILDLSANGAPNISDRQSAYGIR